jgi:hypothetical protein
MVEKLQDSMVFSTGTGRAKTQQTRRASENSDAARAADRLAASGNMLVAEGAIEQRSIGIGRGI